MTLDWSAKVQYAMQATRDFEQLETATENQLDIAMDFETQIDEEIAHHHYRLGAFEDGKDTDTQKEAALREELRILEQMLKDSENDRQCAQALLRSKANILREIQARANAYLEEAFIHARLLEPREDQGDGPIEYRDLQKEFKMWRERQQGVDPLQDIAPLDTRRDYRVPPPTAEQQARRNIVNAFWEAQEALQRAQVAFDRKEQRRAEAWQAHLQAAEREEEPVDTSREDFDLGWLKRFQEFTGELLAAEEAFAAARANALEAGIDMDGEGQLSASEDGEDDRLSFHEEATAFKAEPRITTWLKSLSSPLSPSFNEQPSDTEDWDGADVGLSDSISVVAQGTDRRRIDKWQNARVD